MALSAILSGDCALVFVGANEVSIVFDCSTEESFAAFTRHRIEVITSGKVGADDANLEREKTIGYLVTVTVTVTTRVLQLSMHLTVYRVCPIHSPSFAPFGKQKPPKNRLKQ